MFIFLLIFEFIWSKLNTGKWSDMSLCSTPDLIEYPVILVIILSSSVAVLFALHWLPIRQRIKFKLLVLVYRCLHQLAPAYLSDLIIPYTPARSLRSADSNLITTNIYRLERCGRRRFSVAEPFLWNKLSASVKSANSLGAFKSALKTHLFREAFMTLL